MLNHPKWTPKNPVQKNILSFEKTEKKPMSDVDSKRWAEPCQVLQNLLRIGLGEQPWFVVGSIQCYEEKTCCNHFPETTKCTRDPEENERLRGLFSTEPMWEKEYL